jgi:hypothetical protein
MQRVSIPLKKKRREMLNHCANIEFFFIGKMRVKSLNFIIVYKDLLFGFRNQDLSHRKCCLLQLDQRLILQIQRVHYAFSYIKGNYVYQVLKTFWQHLVRMSNSARLIFFCLF